MNKQQILDKVQELYSSVSGNIMSDTEEVAPPCRGIRLFDPPIVGFGDPGDPLFQVYKKPEIVGPWHRTPREWMPEVGTVISFFFPITEEIRRTNRAMTDKASVQWTYARIDGQAYISSFTRELADWLAAEGIQAFVPALSGEFGTCIAGKTDILPHYECMDDNTFSSNWSERHVAYVCGLGTFALTRGVITERGTAGRFASVLAACRLDPEARSYTGIYDNCIRCGKCITRCPVGAISLEHGKDQKKCSDFLEISKVMFYPRYGCGLCQTGVPCEERNPTGRRADRVGRIAGWEKVN